MGCAARLAVAGLFLVGLLPAALEDCCESGCWPPPALFVTLLLVRRKADP